MIGQPRQIPHPRYYGDGEDTFGKSVWEKVLWALIREVYARKEAEARLSGIEFNAPDWATLVECENTLEKCGLTRTYRDSSGNVIVHSEPWMVW